MGYITTIMGVLAQAVYHVRTHRNEARAFDWDDKNRHCF